VELPLRVEPVVELPLHAEAAVAESPWRPEATYVPRLLEAGSQEALK
jgi:hypothetical protein